VFSQKHQRIKVEFSIVAFFLVRISVGKIGKIISNSTPPE
jgi:hypothetical protein